MSEFQRRTKTITATAVRKSPWQCPGCGRRELEVRGSVQREIREAVRNGELTGESKLGDELFMEVEAIECPTCDVNWVIEPSDMTKLRIENVELKHELAAMRGEAYTAWF